MLTELRHRVSLTGIVTLLPDDGLCFFPEFLAASETAALFRELRNGLSWTWHRACPAGGRVMAGTDKVFMVDGVTWAAL